MSYHYFAVCFLVIGVSVVRTRFIEENQNRLLPSCDSFVYCQGKLLETVQLSEMYQDSKTFVDMSMRQTEEETMQMFDEFMKETNDKPTPEDVEKFVNATFIKADELDDWIPDDFVPNPKFISKIADPKVQKFAQILVDIWKTLGRKVKDDVRHTNRHSIIYVPNGFIIPGGRFREYYYWDSYWIMEGLLHSEMTRTVRHMIDNLIYLVQKFGFIPNGGRVYYEQRSQPPLLSFMAKKYIDATGNFTWLKHNVEFLEREVEFWVNERMKIIRHKNREYQVGTYVAKSRGPRPESYREDYKTARPLGTDEEKQILYDNLKAAAQSGWDFSSRWFFDENGGTNANLSHIQTTRVAPIDLNAFLYGAFNNIADFYQILNDEKKALYWTEKANTILKALEEVFWDNDDGIWYDYDTHMEKRRKLFAASNLTPLWVNGYKGKSKIKQVVKYLEREGIMDYPGGIPCTKLYTGEQWDFPTAFPNLQSVIVQGLEMSGDADAQILARQLAEKWIEAMMIGYDNTKVMFEKYDVTIPGASANSGEYKVQEGFGWTNGVALDFIAKYYVKDDSKEI